MAWRDDLPLGGYGSFRGIQFGVKTAESTVGRKTALHEYAGRDNPYVEDSGQATRRFHLTCFVIGQNYHVDRDRLRKAFETEGSGELIHPYWGKFTATVVSPVKIVETDAEGGIARFDLDLVKTGEEPLTTAVEDLATTVDIKADEALDAAQENFEEGFTVSGVIEDVRSTAIGAITALTSKMRSVRGTMNAALGVIDDVGDAIDEFTELAATLILTPNQLAAELRSLYANIAGGISEIDAATAELISQGAKLTSPSDGPLFADFRATRAIDAIDDLTGTATEQGVSDVEDTGSSQTVVARSNQNQLVLLFRAVAAIEGARALQELDYDSRDKVLEIRTTIGDRLDELASDASSNDALWAALIDLRAAFSSRMLDVAATLPELVDFTPQESVPALVLAYDLYGDAERDREIVARNAIKNPNFVPGSVPIQVFSYE